jgi:hypothetical protein
MYKNKIKKQGVTKRGKQSRERAAASVHTNRALTHCEIFHRRCFLIIIQTGTNTEQRKYNLFLFLFF